MIRLTALSFVFLGIGALLGSGCAGTPITGYNKVLSDSSRNIEIDHWDMAGYNGGHWWKIKKWTLSGGKQDGVDVIDVDNGKMRFLVIPSRGMNVYQVRQGDVRLGWDSPVKEIVHPRHIHLDAYGGLGWLDGFNEWMVRCGLEFAGHPGEDEGGKVAKDLTLHGRIGNIPASEVRVIIEDRAPHRIRIRGRVDERLFPGLSLELWSEVSTTPGSNTLRFDDLVTNHGAQEQEMQIIYHANYGSPLLEKGARFVAPVKRITPFNDHAASELANYSVYAGPTTGYKEMVYCIETYANDKGQTAVMLHDAKAENAVTMAYPVEQLPYFTLWKNTMAKEDGYVTGLEPGTGYPYNRSVERKHGRVPRLGPGESRRFTIDVSIHQGSEAVKAAAEAIKAIQGKRPTKIDKKPIYAP